MEFQNNWCEWRLHNVSCVVFRVLDEDVETFTIRDVKGLKPYQYQCIKFLINDAMEKFEVDRVVRNLTRYANDNIVDKSFCNSKMDITPKPNESNMELVNW